MERLTQYFEVGAYTEKQNIIDISNNLPYFEKGVLIGKAIDKLADFEDLMEENGLNSLEELKIYIERINEYYNEIKNTGTCGFCEHLDNIENQALKDRWQKLKEYITNEFNYDKENIRMVGKDYGYGCINTEEDILAKMQELEKEIK